MIPARLRARCRLCSNIVNYNTNWTSPSKTHQFFNILIDMLLPGVLKLCKLQYEIDLAFNKPTAFQQFDRTFAEILDFYNAKSTLASPMWPWQPLGPEVQPAPPAYASRNWRQAWLAQSMIGRRFPQDSLRMSRGFPPQFGTPTPKQCWAITCNIWPRLEQRPVDSAWFFDTQL